MNGLLGYGVYLPVWRLARERILDAHAWINPALAAYAKGERAVCNWDEDAVTMACESTRGLLRALPPACAGNIRQLWIASTSLPAPERGAGAIVAEAAGLGTDLTSLDLASPRAGLSGLAALLGGQAPGISLCVASEARAARPASAQEMQYGAGAVAMVVGEGEAMARLLGSHSTTVDFMDQVRPNSSAYATPWEERWVRDAGYLQIVPQAVGVALGRLALRPDEVQHVAIATPTPAVSAALARAIGVAPERMVDSHASRCGDIGCAQPLLMLVSALERAAPGDRILVAGFGSGCDVLVLEATEALVNRRQDFSGTALALGRRHPEENYLRTLVGGGQLDVEKGRRAEAQRASPLSVAWRERESVLGFLGGRCGRCGVEQFPRAARCVNPACHAVEALEPVRLADRSGRVLTCTADHLAFSLRPPVHYGIVDIDGGARALLEFADAEAYPVTPGARVRLVLRLRGAGAAQAPRSYFWKAIGEAA